MNTALLQVEDYVRQVMAQEPAHDFKHVDRVRNWALRIAEGEGFEDLEVVQAAALLHDIGLPYVENRKMHGQVGAQIAATFLRERDLFPEEKIAQISDAIRHHNSIREGSGELLKILRDADKMDMFGAVGIMRAFVSKAAKPEYDPRNAKGHIWGKSLREFDARSEQGLEPGDYIVDQINLQIACYEDLSTEIARQLARPLVEFMKNYIIQLEAEVKQSFAGPTATRTWR